MGKRRPLKRHEGGFASPVARAALVLAVVLGATTGTALAASVTLPSPTGSYFVYGNTSHTLSLYSRAGITFDTFPAVMDVDETRGWMYIQAGTATCSRSRVYSNGTLVSNRVEYAAPYYPIWNDGFWHQDYFTYGAGLTVLYPSHGYWQTHDGGAACGYGGGVAWGKASSWAGWSHSATSP